MTRRRYFLLRLLLAEPTLCAISLLAFFLCNLLPGGPVEAKLSTWGVVSEGVGSCSQAITEDQRRALAAYYGFDKPLLKRYVAWVGKVVRGDLGDSYFYGSSVTSLLGRALPFSLLLGVLSILFTHLIAVPVGMFSAARLGRPLERILSALLSLFFSIPPFAMGLILLVTLSSGSPFSVFPLQGVVSENFAEMSLLQRSRDLIWHLALPVVAYSLPSVSALAELVKSTLADQAGKAYVRAAKSRGIGPVSLFIHHVLPAALPALVTHFTQWLPTFFMGSVLIETLFGLPGMGRLSFESLLRRDYPVVLAVILILAVIQVIANLLADFLYTAIDPRVEFQ